MAWLAAIGTAVWFVLHFSGLAAGLDRDFHDQLIRRQPRPPHPDIVIVAIDDKSVAALGRWPWPRSRYAALIRRLGEAGARVVGLDVLLVDPDTTHKGDDQ